VGGTELELRVEVLVGGLTREIGCKWEERAGKGTKGGGIWRDERRMVKRGSIAGSSSAKADYPALLGNQIVVKTSAPGSLSPYQLGC
jgi:hypothetical protein